ncbi:hypothetical protein, partial [Aeromonas veronii]|uniref:hypothetical protein n=1 Tax=Aeromonas veronii TaxID=654 RepID=UPI001F473DFB
SFEIFSKFKYCSFVKLICTLFLLVISIRSSINIFFLLLQSQLYHLGAFLYTKYTAFQKTLAKLPINVGSTLAAETLGRVTLQLNLT